MLSKLINNVNKRIADSGIRKRRRYLNFKYDQLFGSQVKYGIFTGLQLSRSPNWSGSDRASMLFGLYEQEILNELFQRPSSHTKFINLGAADGYYAIGAIKSRLFEEAIAYEINEDAQLEIVNTARLNGVEHKIKVFGKADKSSIFSIAEEYFNQSFILIDIEGAEFDLLDNDVIDKISKSHAIIEIHDFMVDNGDKKLADLKMRLENRFHIKEIKMSTRDLSPFKELEKLPDIDRWLICAERRPCLMTWFRLTPKRT